MRPSKRRRGWWGCGGCLLTAGAGVGILWLLASRPVGPPPSREPLYRSTLPSLAGSTGGLSSPGAPKPSGQAGGATGLTFPRAERVEKTIEFLERRRRQPRREPFELKISQGEFNEWLQRRSHRWPKGVKEGGVVLRPGLVQVWGRVEHGGRDWDVVAEGTVEPVEGGKRVRWRLQRLQLGALPLPGFLRERLMQQAEKDWMEGFPLPEGLQVNEVRVEEGFLTIRGWVGKP